MKNNKGFSLVELIVVIAIMAILAAVAIPTFATFIKKANVASDESYMNDIEYAVELTLAKEGGIPAGHELQVTIADGGAITYDLVKTTAATEYDLSNEEKAEIDAVLEDGYTAKGLKAGKYHKVGENWEKIGS